jgi:hypothetical protein
MPMGTGRALIGTYFVETQSLAPFTLLHNALLSAVSLVLLVALAAELASEYTAAPGGAGAKLWAVWCDPPPRQFTAGRLYFIYYCNYVVKVPGRLTSTVVTLCVCVVLDLLLSVHHEPP